MKKSGCKMGVRKSCCEIGVRKSGLRKKEDVGRMYRGSELLIYGVEIRRQKDIEVGFCS